MHSNKVTSLALTDVIDKIYEGNWEINIVMKSSRTDVSVVEFDSSKRI